MLELFTVDMDYVSCAIKRYETYWHKLLTTLPCHANKLHILMKLYVDWLTTTATTHDNDETKKTAAFAFYFVLLNESSERDLEITSQRTELTLPINIFICH